MLATSAVLWVMRMMAVPSSRLSCFSSWITCAWTVTSSAVVGSSAISSEGSLAHPARELMGIVADPPLGRRHANPLEQRHHALGGLGGREPVVRRHRFFDLRPDLSDRVQ